MVKVTKRKEKTAEEIVFLKAAALMTSGDKVKQVAHSRGYKLTRLTLFRSSYI